LDLEPTLEGALKLTTGTLQKTMKNPATPAKTWVLMLGLIIGLSGITIVSSFLPTSKHLNARQSLVVCDMSKQPSTFYNDDAFGLVFLGGGALAQDPIFTGVFLAMSAVAATASAQGKLASSDNKIPAAVAGITLVLTPAVAALVASLPESPVDPTAGNPSARFIELALCSVSIVYGLVTAAKSE
jgi:hypothetical protein